jgi:hypothetical protein
MDFAQCGITIMDSAQHVQVGVDPEYPLIDSLSLRERARVRGLFRARRNHENATHKKARRQSLVCGLRCNWSKA